MYKKVEGVDEMARKVLNEYHRKWRAQNKDKSKEIQKRYWRKKALALAEAEGEKVEIKN